MVPLVLYLVLVLLWWWVWIRWALRRPPTRPTEPPATAAPPPAARRGPGTGAAARPPARRRRGLDAPPLTEDDVIAFGLALEGTQDVARSALTCPGRAAGEPRAQRDAPGRS